MAYRRRIFFHRRTEVRDLGSLSAMHASPVGSGWQRGESMSSIGRVFDRASSSIYPLLERTGGIRPPERQRSRLALTLVDREEISRGLIAQLSVRSIARSLKRPASTISREVRRNGGAKLYRAAQSDAAAWDPLPTGDWYNHREGPTAQNRVSWQGTPISAHCPAVDTKYR